MIATLLTDGSSDQVLLPILRWLIASLTSESVEIVWADLRCLPDPPSALKERVSLAVEYYPCDLLFIHRDAELEAPEKRVEEIPSANSLGHKHVCVVPVRMQEAWLLLDECALRRAAGRPSGREPLNLPTPTKVERVANPKAILHSALMRASGLKGRRAKQFNVYAAAHRLADLVVSWDLLRQLSAFKRLEHDTRVALRELGAKEFG
jgi:hypothetical protein